MGLQLFVESPGEAGGHPHSDIDADLVAITSMTPLAPRAYEISSRFKERGTNVVLGGIHPSMMPDEASRFADAVVVGEGEDIWPKVLKDFENCSIQFRRPRRSQFSAPTFDAAGHRCHTAAVWAYANA